MAQQPINVLREPIPLEQLCDELAKLQKTLRWMLNGNIDFENIRAKGIIADNIQVDQLSAISANLGHITAGLIEAVQIFGSYIATSQSYPRAEMSSTNKLFGAYRDANNYVAIKTNTTEVAAPGIEFVNNSIGGQVSIDNSEFTMQSRGGSLRLRATGNIYLGDVLSSDINIASWNRLFNLTGMQSLQDALNAKANNFSGITGTVYVATTPGGPANTPIQFINGVRTS